MGTGRTSKWVYRYVGISVSKALGILAAFEDRPTEIPKYLFSCNHFIRRALPCFAALTARVCFIVSAHDSSGWGPSGESSCSAMASRLLEPDRHPVPERLQRPGVPEPAHLPDYRDGAVGGDARAAGLGSSGTFRRPVHSVLDDRQQAVFRRPK